ncbi:hypothetical protein [Sphingosinicella sp. CPCC 101087]|uniref:hypothetical protein n=1 Tax=Sphingosinicella sp. CPCC 101087 TaxID=2497754 RepID=UPI00101DBABF|nr:hypothetical protein [Sphingosinicella sp. CPCC 101087]
MRAHHWFIAAFAVAAPAAAQEAQTQRPAALTRLIDCRAVQGEAERLACYDAAVAAFETAEQNNEVVVMDRQQVRRTRRSLFGLVLPDLDIFGDNQVDEVEGVSELETTIRSVREDGYGKWVFVLEDGARWRQLDSRELAREPRPGNTIRIRRAAMGSYLANIEGQVAIRVRREQ